MVITDHGMGSKGSSVLARLADPVIAGNDQTAPVLAALELDGMYRSGRVPSPTLLFYALGDFALVRPTGSVIIARNHKDPIVFQRERQPDSSRMIGIEQIDHRSGVADRNVLGPSTQELYEIGTFLNHLQGTPGFATVLGALDDQVDLACISPLPGLAKSEQMTIGRLDHGRNPVNPVPILTRLEYSLRLESGQRERNE